MLALYGLTEFLNSIGFVKFINNKTPQIPIWNLWCLFCYLNIVSNTSFKYAAGDRPALVGT